jgi:transcriptional/translational regulatory protein YebC/TACO1
VTAPHDFTSVERALQKAGVTVESSEIALIPTTTVPVDGGDARHVLHLIDALEELDDVQNVYANFDIPEDVMASL